MNTQRQQIEAEIDKLKGQAQSATADVKLGILRSIDDLQEQLKKVQDNVEEKMK